MTGSPLDWKPPLSTTTPKPALGAGAAGTAAGAARSDHVHAASSQLGPADCGYIGWTADPQVSTSTMAVAAAQLTAGLVKATKTGPISNVIIPISTGHASVTGGFVAIYALDGTLLGQSADQGTSWVTAGTKTVALTAPTASIPAGTLVYAALLPIGGAPTIRAQATAPSVNFGAVRFCYISALSAIPSPLGAATASTVPFLLIVS